MATRNRRKAGARLLEPGLIVLSCAILGAVTYLSAGLLSDDAFIYSRYLRNVVEGHGLVYNVGERVSGLTSPVFTYLAGGLSLVTGDVLLSQTLLFLLPMAGVVYLIFGISRQGGRDRVHSTVSGFLASLAVVAFPFFYRTIGLETALFVLLLLAVVYAYQEERYGICLILSALLLLTRSEGVFLALAVLAYDWTAGRGLWRAIVGIRALVAPAVLLAAHYGFHLYYYGSLLPASADAKLLQGQSEFWGEWPTAFIRSRYLLDFVFASDGFLIAGSIGFFLIGFFRNECTRAFKRIFSVFLVLYTAFYVLLNIPNYHWYFAPLFLFFFMNLGLGIAWLGREALTLDRWRRTASLAIGLMLIAFFVSVARATLMPGIRVTPEHHQRYVETAAWLQSHTTRNASVAAAEIGIIGWASERPIVDMLGLVTPEHARWVGEQDMGAWLEHSSPDYILIHDPIWRLEEGVEPALRSGEYVPVEDFPVEGLELLRRTDREAGESPTS